jgi:signal transduction histidine kinase
MLLLLMTTILYWVIDTHYLNLPDPVLPYIFYILIIGILFGLRVSVYTAVITFFLISYYLFEPRYNFYTPETALSIILTIFGIAVSILIAHYIRQYQERLLKEQGTLRALVKARDQFAAVTAHDLKTPITTIKLYSQLLGKEQLSKQAGKTLAQSTATINQEADKLLSMIDLLLDFSKLQEGKLTIHKERVNLCELCTERIDTMRSLYPFYTFALNLPRKSCFIYADKVALDRVITNLLSNAAKYSPEKTTIMLNLKKQGDVYLLSVNDQGQGIAKEHQKSLFKPFYQVAGSKQGLGLGLYIVKVLVELHSGKIWLTSKVNHGTTFYISLPKGKAS